MKYFRFILLLSVVLTASLCHAMSPPPEKTLEQGVEMATHVFIGVVKNVKVVEVRDGKVREALPAPASLDGGQAAEIEMEVKEVLYPSGYKSAGTIKYLFGDGMFSVDSIRKDTLGQELIYLLQVHPELKQPYFLPSWSWQLAQGLDYKIKIQAVLEEKVRKEHVQLTAPTAPIPLARAASAPPARIEMGQEVQVSRDGDFPHWEISMRVDAARPDFLLASCITQKPSDKPWTTMTYASRDGGKTWTAAAPARDNTGDPVVAFGLGGDAFFASLHHVGGQFIGAHHSPDGGLTWSERVTPFSDSSKADHEMIVVDRSASRFKGRLYLAAQYNSGRILVHRSDDRGRTFKTTIAVAAWKNGFVNNIEVFGDGTLFVPLQTGRTFKTTPDGRYAGSTTEHWCVTSSDGGETFSMPRKIYDSISGQGGEGGASNAVYAVGAWKGRERIYALGCDTRSGAARLWLCHSDDKGVTWSALRDALPELPQTIIPGACNIAATRDGHVGLSWLGFKPGKSDEHETYFAASLDGGQSFGAVQRVSTRTSPVPPKQARYPGGDYMLMDATSDGVFQVVWPDARSGNYQIFTRRVRVTAPKAATPENVPPKATTKKATTKPTATKPVVRR